MSRDLDIEFCYTAKMATRRSGRKIKVNQFYGFSEAETKRNETFAKPKRKRYVQFRKLLFTMSCFRYL